MFPENKRINTSEIERLAGHHEVKSVIVEGGYINRFPNFVIETLFKLLLDCIFVEFGEMPLEFLGFALGE